MLLLIRSEVITTWVALNDASVVSQGGMWAQTLGWGFSFLLRMCSLTLVYFGNVFEPQSPCVWMGTAVTTVAFNGYPFPISLPPPFQKNPDFVQVSQPWIPLRNLRLSQAVPPWRTLLVQGRVHVLVGPIRLEETYFNFLLVCMNKEAYFPQRPLVGILQPHEELDWCEGCSENGKVLRQKDAGLELWLETSFFWSPSRNKCIIYFLIII